MEKNRRFIWMIAIFLLLRASTVFAQDPDPDRYLNSLIKKAVEKNLAEDRYWRLLLYYKRTFFGGDESEEDGPAFFNAPDGKYNPESELIATLTLFFAPPPEPGLQKEHPQCEFPARYKWLKAQLSFDPAQLPEQRCERLDAWLKEMEPEKITLVFAAHYMNNPASMFGHTLLRIDKKRKGPEQKLLDHGVNYAATADTANPLIYTIKGMFGGFKGVFTLFPYYFKVQEYSNLESRDLWEYELNFTEDQMNDLLLHLWELGGNYFDYYYFQENCSYHLLSLLEVADPDLHLTDQFWFHVIPGDTVKALTRYPALISKRVYRPSLLSQMNEKRRLMTAGQKEVLYRLAKDPSAIETEDYRRLSVPEKGLVLDAYLDFAQYQTMKKEKSAAVLDKQTRAILLERSKLEAGSDRPAGPPFSAPPELGHGSARVRVGAGVNRDEFFEEISIRPAYHDLMAAETGYGKDSQILFLETTARYYDRTKTLRLDQFKLIDIVSLTPYDPLFRKKSWRLSLGIDTIRDFDCRYCNSAKGSYGIGLAYRQLDGAPVLLYALLQFELEISRRLQADYRAGGGPVAGAIIELGERWKLDLYGSDLRFPLGHDSNYYNAGIEQRYTVTRDLDLRVELRTFNARKEAVAAVNYYF